MNVHWTDNAIRHLNAIHDYIAANSPVYAKAMIDKLTRRSEQLAAFPNSGRRVPEHEAQDIREVIERPYRIIYRILPDRIDVVAVVHSAQILPEELS